MRQNSPTITALLIEDDLSYARLVQKMIEIDAPAVDLVHADHA